MEFKNHNFGLFYISSKVEHVLALLLFKKSSFLMHSKIWLLFVTSKICRRKFHIYSHLDWNAKELLSRRALGEINHQPRFYSSPSFQNGAMGKQKCTGRAFQGKRSFSGIKRLELFVKQENLAPLRF